MLGHKTEFIWDSFQRVSMDNFNAILAEARIIPLNLDEYLQPLD